MVVDSFQDIEFQKHDAALEWVLAPKQQRLFGIILNCKNTCSAPKKKMVKNKVK